MYGKTFGVLSVALVAGPALSSAAAAQTPAAPAAQSYAELLEPIPNAAERLRLDDQQAAQRPARLIEAQWGGWRHHHHHHHHHGYWGGPYYYYDYGPGPYYQPWGYGYYYGPGYYGWRHHHHHHHHHRW
jgi:hypothetical protein